MQCPKCGSDNLVKDGIKKKLGRQRYRCRGCNNWRGIAVIQTESEIAAGLSSITIDELYERVVSGKIKRYVITAAQNATPVWQPFFKTLLTYCWHNNAQLLVIPYRYKNPTSRWSVKAESEDWWASELQPYLYDRRTVLCKYLELLADIKMQPTAVRPLVGFETITGARSAILGHPKLELLTVPTPQESLPKVLTTTGTITKKNYIPAKAGKRAEFHHTFGAAIVEMGENDQFFLRQINATRSGSFCDLDMEYYPNKPPKKVRIEALVLGDVHVEHVDPTAVEAVFGAEGIVPTLQPKKLVWHDVLDFYSRTHHHEGQVFINYVKHHAGLGNVKAELSRAFAFVDKHTPKGVKNIFVYSNHSDMLSRWVKRADPKSDPENAIFWAETFVAMCEGSGLVPGGVATIDPFAYWGEKMLKCFRRSRFLGAKESSQIKSIEVGYHGHQGPSGTRGTRQGFTKIGTKSIIMHIHAPGITEGVYQGGMMAYLMSEYAAGPSARLHCHVVIYRSGKRSLLISLGENWRG